MLRFVFALATAAFILAAPAHARDDRDNMLPQYSKLLTKLYDQKNKSCPYAMYNNGMMEMIPSVSVRKDKNDTKEFIIVRYYPMYEGTVTLEVHTEGARFENKCRAAGVSISSKNGELGSGGYMDCPNQDPDKMTDAYGFKENKPFGTEFIPAWKKRAEEYLAEVEYIAAMCK